MMFIGIFERYRGSRKIPIPHMQAIKRIDITERHHVYLDEGLKYIVDIVEVIEDPVIEYYAGDRWEEVSGGFPRSRWYARHYRLYDAPTWLLLKIIEKIMPEIYRRIPEVLSTESAS